MPKRGSGGLISLILLIVLALLVLSFFHINLRSLVESDTAKANFNYAFNYAKGIGLGIYNFIFQHILSKIKP